jgi:predicted naringenin-chalcone synthase
MNILGLGTAVPTHFIEQMDAAQHELAYCGGNEKQQQVLTALYRRAGVQKRHSVLLESSTNGKPANMSFFPKSADTTFLGPGTGQRMAEYDRAAADLAEQAVNEALRDAAVLGEEVTHLVSVSCSGFSAPGFDIELVERLALSRGIARTHIGFMGCHGALNGLRVSHALANSQPNSTVLLVALELCSLHFQYDPSPQRIVANSLFADGAAALICRANSNRSRTAWKLAANWSEILPETSDLMSWRIGDHGFEMNLSPQVPKVIESTLGPWLSEKLASRGLTLGDIRAWSIHPGGPKILQACQTALGLSNADLAPSRQVLAECGNMSSPTVLFILDALRRQSAAGPCVMLGFGPGLTVEAALLD